MTGTKIAMLLPAALLLSLGVPSWPGPGQKNDQAEMLLQQAQHKELVEGQLEQALQIYKKILAGYAGNRAVAAKALVEMGQCYEKLGKAEARSSYERVLRDYSDQADAASLARQRLAALRSERHDRSQVAARRIWAAGALRPYPAVSSDGRYVTYWDMETGNLGLCDLTTGETRLVTHDASYLEWEFSAGGAISPDNTQVAYLWTVKHRDELRIARLDGSAVRILHRGEKGIHVIPLGWSADGKEILAVAQNGNDDTYQRVLVSAVDGSIRSLGRPDKRWPRWGTPSPDGRYIAFDLPATEGSEKNDIFLLETATGRDIPLVQNPAHDFVLGWAPEGRRLVFGSDMSGTKDIWVLEVENGKPKGSPQMVKRDLGSGFPIGLTRQGALVQWLSTGTSSLYTAAFDRETGKLAAAPEPVNTHLPDAEWPEWSPDGKFLCYVSMRGPSDSISWVLTIRSAESGEEREVKPKPPLRHFYKPRWSPDGRFLLLTGSTPDASFGLIQIDAETGEDKLVVKITGDNPVDPAPNWYRDGRAVFYNRRDPVEGETFLIMRKNLETGEEKEIHRGIHTREKALSPDGKQFAFYSNDRANRSYTVMAMEIGGSQPRVLARVQPPMEISGSIAWTPDGHHVLYGKELKQRTELWRVPAGGGEPQQVGTLSDSIFGLTVHPNGRLLGFAVFRDSHELWVLENFLPPWTAGK